MRDQNKYSRSCSNNCSHGIVQDMFCITIFIKSNENNTILLKELVTSVLQYITGI